ncbi:GGDEF domain-containing response regulator [Aliivibrio fischeri]|uniref:GGDEF domain-containing response regulator n=1 Tax=Aliivibrio fischeri TaxID=668 RepID=UPI0037357715
MLTEPKILIAEDEPVSRLVLQRLLKAFTCISVTNGQEALDVIHQEHIDLVLLDIHMPIMDGFEVIEKLKNNEATKNIPIIVITVNQSIEDEIRALDLGAVDFVTKPFHAVILQKRIRNQLALKLKSDLLEKHASLDGLTNLLNRRMFDFDLENRWAESQRLKGNLGLIIFDIDHFKLFNDNYGHSAGDEVLIRVAKALMRTLQRKTDRVYRYGGEEFTLIQFDTDLEQLRQTAELLRQCIYDLNITHEFSSHGRVSISVGAALINAESIKSEQFLLETADQQLYKAKKQGRNCVSLISN